MDEERDVEGEGERITELMMNTTIDGVTGPVVMNSNGDRLAYYSVLALNETEKVYKEVLTYSAMHKNLTNLAAIGWPGNCENMIYRKTRIRTQGEPFSL